MKLRAMLEGVSIIETRGDVDVDINGVQCDSRRVRAGDVYVAIRGEKADGHEFIGEAVGAGAIAVVCERVGGQALSIIQARVEDSRKALACMAANFYGRASERLQVVGITGTNGKTTTSYLVAAIFEAAGMPAGVIGTLGCRIGNRQLPSLNTTPSANELQELFAQMAHSGMKAVSMEVSSHSLMQRRVDEIAWDAAVFTNLTQDHLDYHRSMEEYFKAKRKLFEQLGKGAKKGVAILNADDPRAGEMREALRPGVRAVTFGLQREADVRAEVLEHSINGSRFRFHAPPPAGGGEGVNTEMRTALCGAHNVSNCLAAGATALALGLEAKAVQHGIESVRNVPGRLERVNIQGQGGHFSVFVDYAHTDDALRNVLNTLRALIPATGGQARGRLITVFGCGGDRDATKRPLMGKVAGELSDLSIITTDNPRSEDPSAIARQIRTGFGARKNFEVVLDRRSAIRRGLLAAGEGDVVLLAGKGHEAYQEVKGTRTPFDDRQVAQEEMVNLSTAAGAPRHGAIHCATAATKNATASPHPSASDGGQAWKN